jgi:hypothetical protein
MGSEGNGTNLIEAQAVAVRFSHRQIMATEVATTLKFVPFGSEGKV